jgi:uncharacterized membrane protein HdeD (DUF308 family)
VAVTDPNSATPGGALDRRPPSLGRPGPGDPAMSAVLAQNWWAVALRGVAAILFGLLALFAPGAVLITLALFFAAYLLVDGVLGIVAAIRAAQKHQRWGLLLAEGVLDILVGIVAFLFPVSAVVAFVLVTAAWALVTGGLMIAAAFKLGAEYGRGWMILSGVVSILFGLALLFAPLLGAVVLTWWFAGYAIAFGALLLVLAFKLRGRKALGAGPSAVAAG